VLEHFLPLSAMSSSSRFYLSSSGHECTREIATVRMAWTIDNFERRFCECRCYKVIYKIKMLLTVATKLKCLLH
jgi:hypothetical protein